MFVFLRRLAKMSLFFWSCFASSKRPQLGEFGDPHLLCFFQPRGTPACSSDAPQGNANLPGFAYLSPACGSAHWEMHKSDTLWRLARGDVLPGRSKTHIPPALLVICVPGLRLLCRDVLVFFIQPLLLPSREQGKSRTWDHAKASLQTPVPTDQGAVIFSPQGSGSTRACAPVAGLLVHCATVHPDFPWENLNLPES